MAQRSPPVRTLWCFAVGWWLGWLRANVAVLSALSILSLPVAFRLFNPHPSATSLYRFHG